MRNQPITRRQFLRMGTIGSSAWILAACGATSVAEPTATAVPPTEAPAAAGSGSSAAAGSEVEVLVGDVLDFALESDSWPGEYGFATFRLHEGFYKGEPIYFIRTDSSEFAYAEENGLVFVPLLNAGRDIAASLYLFDGGHLPVLSSSPSEADYVSLFHVKNVTVSDATLTLDSAEEIEAAAAAGGVSIAETNVLVNHPVVKWPGGELPADPDKQEALGKGPLIESVNVAELTVTFKLHQCFPGSRYIVTDTSAAPMAPMMNIAAAPPTQALMEAGATDEIWVFANGIPGPGVMGFQPAIFDNKAGSPAWSPFWNHFTLKWADESNARVLRSSVEIRELLDTGELEQFNGVPDSHPNGFVVNCPAPILAPNNFEA